MKSGIQCKQGEIVIVLFPFSNLSSLKQRPVLVLSKNNYIKNAENIITCEITSNIKNSKYSVLIDRNNLEEGSIPIKSRIKIDKLFTLNKNLVKRK